MSLRPLALTVVVALAAPAIPAARADQLNGGVVSMELRLPSESNPSNYAAPTPTYLKKYFNQARCACDKSGTDQLYQIRYTWQTAPTSAVSQPLEIWVGLGCQSDNPQTTRDNCAKLAQIVDPDALTQTVEREYSVSTLLFPKLTTCEVADRVGEHWAVTETSDAVWDADNRAQLTVAADLLPPPVPTTVTLAPLESGITLEWDAPTDRADDIAYYQALCAKEDGSLAHTTPTHSAQYQTTRTLCGAATDPALPAATIKNDTGAPTGTLPVALSQLSSSFVCGQSTGGSSISLEGLENGQAYWVVLLSVDAAGNVAGVYVDRPITPQPVTDFWEELNNEDPYVQGGFCVAQVGTTGGLGAVALVTLATLIAVRRRRRPGRRLAGLITLALVLAPTIASAQESYSPYWQDDPADATGLDEATWALGIRLGPYRPSIDAKFDSSPGPYARTFLKDSVLFAVDLHRVWNLARGQLGVGVTAGYYSNSALAWEDGSLPSDPMRPRASKNLTRLSIVPTALTAIYRATIIDDELGVPIVPYVRGGVAYDVWWIKNPADELSTHMSCATCSDKAIGGTIGLVAAVGLAVRAERIDEDAAISMRNSGLAHAGFFAEVELGWVDGFGNDTKLSVGDTTWFGGINFEF